MWVHSIMGVKLVKLSNKLWNRKTQQILFLQSYENVVKHLANFVNKTLRNIWWLTFKTFICVYFVNTIVIESAEEARKKSLSSWNSCNSLRTGWTYARKDQHKGFGFSLTISIAKLILFEWQRMKNIFKFVSNLTFEWLWEWTSERFKSPGQAPLSTTEILNNIMAFYTGRTNWCVTIRTE